VNRRRDKGTARRGEARRGECAEGRVKGEGER
jgi:hypothetical protein